MDYVSCHPDLLYRSGGFYDEPALLAQLSERWASGIPELSLIGEVFPPFAYERPVPEHVWASKPEPLARLAADYDLFDRSYRHGAAGALFAIAGGYVRGAVVYLKAAGRGQILFETHRGNDRSSVELLRETELDLNVVQIPEDGAIHLFLGSAGSANYGHWLVDDLPRIRALHSLRAAGRTGHMQIWLTSYGYAIDRVRLASLKQVCAGLGDFGVEFLRLDRTYRFERLHYMTPVSFHPVLKSPDALDYLTGQVLSRAKPATPLRLFVTRRGSRSRVLQNNAAVQSLLLSHGFICADVEQMDFEAQALTFAAATIVVGCMGAAMTNTVFSPPGTHLVYLVPEGWQEPFYWDMAAIKKHRYSAIYGDVDAGDEPAHLKSYTIDIAQLAARLAQIIA